MCMWLESSHAISDAACAAVAAGDPDAAELVSAAKAYIGQYGAELVQDCVQMHGGIGVTFEHDLHLFLRRVTVNRALAGTPADHRQRITGLHRGAGRGGGVSALRAETIGGAGEPGGLPAAGPVLHPGQPAAGHARGAALGAQRSTTTRRSSPPSPATASSSACCSTPSLAGICFPASTAARG